MSSYGWENFYFASEGLQKSIRTRREALIDAYCHHIIHIQNHDVPKVCVEALEKLHQELNLPLGVTPFNGQNGCAYKVSTMKDDKVDELVKLIYETYKAIERIEKTVQY
jgi:hypothetical protein